MLRLNFSPLKNIFFCDSMSHMIRLQSLEDVITFLLSGVQQRSVIALLCPLINVLQYSASGVAYCLAMLQKSLSLCSRILYFSALLTRSSSSLIMLTSVVALAYKLKKKSSLFLDSSPRSLISFLVIFSLFSSAVSFSSSPVAKKGSPQIISRVTAPSFFKLSLTLSSPILPSSETISKSCFPFDCAILVLILAAVS